MLHEIVGGLAQESREHYVILSASQFLITWMAGFYNYLDGVLSNCNDLTGVRVVPRTLSAVT